MFTSFSPSVDFPLYLHLYTSRLRPQFPTATLHQHIHRSCWIQETRRLSCTMAMMLAPTRAQREACGLQALPVRDRRRRSSSSATYPRPQLQNALPRRIKNATCQNRRPHLRRGAHPSHRRCAHRSTVLCPAALRLRPPSRLKIRAGKLPSHVAIRRSIYRETTLTDFDLFATLSSLSRNLTVWSTHPLLAIYTQRPAKGCFSR